MFEQSMLAKPSRKRGAITIVLSTAAESGLVCLAVLLPLLNPPAMPEAALLRGLTTPSSPRGSTPKQLDAVKIVEAKAIPRQFDGSRLMAPREIPRKVEIIDDGDLPLVAATACTGCVPGGIGAPDSPSIGVISGIGFEQPPVPPPPPPAKPPAEENVVQRIPRGGDVQEAMILKRVMPEYPQIARQMRVSGVVRLIGVIGTDGRIQQLQVVEGHPLLVKAALDAVRQWVYRPTLLNGKPVEVIAPIEVNFRLN
ncbi:MAG: energy transducer TonB [Bryobacteraceae bacterium]|nr:energy transducer TonB [Bryobacteraceae bacterium]